ncbi:MAG TPA: cobalt-precorrin 5A hydrolase [Ruminococcus flavefaciens]|nr:cobalt-precorrin 5A hydrolase [Ruminococcus flavefaciens]
MKAAVISFTENGRVLSAEIKKSFSDLADVQRYCFAKHTDGDVAEFVSVSSLVGDIFRKMDALIFVCACGIAVRAIAPFIRSKTTDPAVIVIDEKGRYVIPVLSGHIGGANRFAEIIAGKLGAVAAVTTATDTGKLFSPDCFASANGLLITDMTAAKEVAAALVNGEKCGFYTEYPHSELPDELTENNKTRTGVAVCTDESLRPFPVTLTLVPKNIVVGIGCKRGTSVEAIENAVNCAFSEAGLDTERICTAATINIKADEQGINEFCHLHSIPLRTYAADELMKAEGEFESSPFVLETVGADNICERSAVLCSGGQLVIRKKSGGGVTVAAAEIPIYLDFERKIL